MKTFCRGIAILAACAWPALLPAAEVSFLQSPMPDGDSLLSERFDEQILDNFSFAEETTLTTLRWWGTYLTSQAATDTFTIRLFGEQAGEPRLDFQTELTGLTVSRSDSGLRDVFGDTIYQYQAPITSPLVIPAGSTSYLSVLNDTTDGWFWQKSDTNQTNFFRFDDLDSWVTAHSGNLAFEIIGMTQPQPPAFSTWNVNANGAWSIAGNWNGGVPNAAGAHAVFGSVISAPRTVTVDAPITVGRIDFDNANAYTIAGTSALTLDAAAGSAEIHVTSGNHTISATLTLLDNTLIEVTPAASGLSLSAPLTAPNVSLTKTGPGTLTAARIGVAGLSLEGGTVILAPGGASASTLGALSIAGGAAPTATLNLTDNAAVIDYTGASPVATVRQQIIAGRGGAGFGASWTGNGINSTAAATANGTEAESRSIGYTENARLPLGPFSVFHGRPVDATSVLMAYTRTGDANLDGVVNDDDVTILSATYAPGVPQPEWAFGDFDYNGFVDDDDATLLGAFYNPAATPLATPVATSAGGTSIAAVPEPSTIVLLASLSVCLSVCYRRSRRRHTETMPPFSS